MPPPQAASCYRVPSAGRGWVQASPGGDAEDTCVGTVQAQARQPPHTLTHTQPRAHTDNAPSHLLFDRSVSGPQQSQARSSSSARVNLVPWTHTHAHAYSLWSHTHLYTYTRCVSHAYVVYTQEHTSSHTYPHMCTLLFSHAPLRDGVVPQPSGSPCPGPALDSLSRHQLITDRQPLKLLMQEGQGQQEWG